MDDEKREQTEDKKAFGDSVVTVSYAEALANYVKKFQLYIGMALASIGATYQAIIMMNFGWQTTQRIISSLTPLSYLPGVLQQQALIIFIIGVVIWFTEPTAHTETQA